VTTSPPAMLASRLVETLFADRDSSSLPALVSPQALPSLLLQAIARMTLLAGFPDYGWSVDQLVAEGDEAIVLSTIEGTHLGPVHDIPATGRRVRFTAIDEFRVIDGRIAAARLGQDLGVLLAQLATVPSAPEPVLALDEIQGNVLPGFKKDHTVLVFLEIVDVPRTKRWLGDFAGQVASAAEVLQFNRLFASARRRRNAEGTVRATWINVALSFAALSKLRPDADDFTDEAFRADAHARAELLGIGRSPDDPGSPETWIVGGRSRPVEIILIAADDDERHLQDTVDALQESLQGVRVVHVEHGHTRPGPLTGHEQFGFADGISQPGLRGRASAAPCDFVTPRLNPLDSGEGLPGQKLVWPGEFVFGYPRQDPADPTVPGPIADAGPAWAENGSLLVFQRYRQEVERFDAFIASAPAQLGPDLAARITPGALAAKLLGRWPSGAPLARAAESDDPVLADDRCAVNHFAFASASPPIGTGEGCRDETFPAAPADPMGLRCPRAAHIRKAYPRDDLGSQVHGHRILRRGTPFGGEEADGERGLLFLAYQTSIERQFEFIIRSWLNDPDFASSGAGIDPILGRSPDGTRRVAIPFDADGSVATGELELPDPWTIPTGGGYFFAPAISALAVLAC
jgi:Dyp-type peroxidase family